MGQIKVTDPKTGGTLYTINTNNTTGAVTSVTPGTNAPVDKATIEQLLKGMTFSDTAGPPWSLDKLMASIQGDVASKTGAAADPDVAKRLDAMTKAIQKLESKLAATTDPAQKAVLTNALQMAKASAKELIEKLEKNESKLDATSKASLTAAKGLMDAAGSSGATAGKAQVSSPTQQSQGAQAGAAPQQAFPGAGKAQAAQQPFDVAALMQSSFFQTANLNSLDQLGKTQMDQKKMMMLFMYFAMQAMSGDIGAMTAFMQFISTIILKDKSMQNVNMANKLIELEDNSRKATDQLLNTASSDPNNPQVAADFAKVMERTKAEQGSIATSQKLIAQMMEEFAQVSEFLNNLQKSLLDVRGRLLSRMSSFNA